MLEALRPLAMMLMLPLTILACSNSEDDSDTTGLSLIASCGSSLTGTGPRVFLDCGSASGGLVTVNVIGADITDEVDAYNLIIKFSPSAFQYVRFDREATLFEPSVDCDLSSSVLCLDNAGTANTQGQIVLGVSLIGMNPSGKVIGAGNQEILARLIFQAASAGEDSPTFTVGAQPGCVGQATTGNALLEVSSSQTCQSTVINGITFSNEVILKATL